MMLDIFHVSIDARFDMMFDDLRLRADDAARRYCFRY